MRKNQLFVLLGTLEKKLAPFALLQILIFLLEIIRFYVFNYTNVFNNRKLFCI